MKVERNILSKENLAELENLVNRLDVAVDHSMKDYFELVEKYLAFLRSTVNNQIHDMSRDVCVVCADCFNEMVKSELGEISIGNYHCYQGWGVIYVAKDKVDAFFDFDWEFEDGKIREITLDKSTFKVLPRKW